MSVAPEVHPWSALLELGRADQRLVREAFEGARAPITEPLPEELHPALLDALRTAGIASLWAHQAQALHAGWAGPTIVTTGTASGKSLCFNLPTLDVLCRDAKARALYLYPTKALAQDQARAVNAFGLTRQVRPAIYDGDTPQGQRAQIRRRANLILTNPDMLHMGILPHHRRWADFFSNLAVIVVDEAHVYRGVFGSHVANVLRRLRRIANAYGTEPRILLASATIANPVELAEKLTGLDEIALVVPSLERWRAPVETAFGTLAIPFALEGRVGRAVLPLLWFTWNRVLTMDTPIGRRVRPKIRAGGGPLLRVKRAHLAAAGVELHPPGSWRGRRGGCLGRRCRRRGRGLCAGLLLRSWWTDRLRLLLWAALGFTGLAVNNLLLVVDERVLPGTDLGVLRDVSALVAVSVLLFGLIWEGR
ncbi:MAG: DEAD/DEAH box helicase [Actinobacteria bacterium]|nr:DEAD/DEAH box helicase [Actinomycetota bacterium]